jgi:hypothetical protein
VVRGVSTEGYSTTTFGMRLHVSLGFIPCPSNDLFFDTLSRGPFARQRLALVAVRVHAVLLFSLDDYFERQQFYSYCLDHRTEIVEGD